MLLTEQDDNTQIREVLFLVAETDVAEDSVRLIQMLLPRMKKLVNCKPFKVKSAGMVVNGIVIGAGGTMESSGGKLSWLLEALDGKESSRRGIRGVRYGGKK